MADETSANDNDYLEYGVLDPQRHYVREYMEIAVAHFKDCNIRPSTIFAMLEDALFKLLPGNPYRDPVDEGALLSDLHLLWPLQDRVGTLIEEYKTGLDRADRQRQMRQADKD